MRSGTRRKLREIQEIRDRLNGSGASELHLSVRDQIREHAKVQPDGFQLIADSFGFVSDAIERLRAGGSAPGLVLDSLHGGGRGVVDVLGELVERLPDALSVAEVCIVLDGFDVALRGHGMDSCSVDGGAGNTVCRTTVQASVASDAADTRAGVVSTPVPAPARDDRDGAVS